MKNSSQRRIVVWMRRALRIQDQAALWHAVQDADEVIPFVSLSTDGDYRKDSPRRLYLRSAILDLDRNLRRAGSRLFVAEGDAETTLLSTCLACGADAAYAVSVYDPRAIVRDAKIEQTLRGNGIRWLTFKDSVLREGPEIRSRNGAPYKIFTPFKKAWLECLPEVPKPFPAVRRIHSPEPKEQIDLCAYPGFERDAGSGGETAAMARLRKFIDSGLGRYDRTRDFPAADGTSQLSPHLANGTLSIRTVVNAVLESRASSRDLSSRKAVDVFMSELIWREFAYHVLINFPSIVDGPFRREFERLPWSDNARHFDAWSSGLTGYPIVDAGMRQLKAEGWIHNRVRMIVASFLAKDLHINWQRGEALFLDQLIDADVASNNLGWQWMSGTGTDAAPYYRIFNPVLQGKKFDPEGEYIRRFVPELARVPARLIHHPWDLSDAEQREYGCVIGKQYPAPVVDHNEERRAALLLLKSVRPG